MEKEIRAYWQAIRGICILAVVLIHSLVGFQYADGRDTALIIIRQLINFAVPLFIFMAGYFVDPEKMTGDDFQYKKWLIHRGGRLLIPFVIWSIFYSGISILHAALEHQEINWVGVVGRFLIGKSATPFYYIVVLLQLTVITPWLVKIVKQKGKAEKLLWLVTPAYLVYIYFYNFIHSDSPRFYEVLFLIWFGFYYLGIQVKCGRMRLNPVTVSMRGRVFLVAGAFAFSCVEALLLRACGMSRGFYVSQTTVGAFLYASALIGLICDCRNCDGCFLSKVGDCSYGIFYIHMFVLMFAGKIVEILNVSDVWIAYWGIRFLFTSVVSYAIVRFSQKVLGSHRRELRWIGFV